jgi:glycosyltransferase involved in cell wall biosynthesis
MEKQNLIVFIPAFNEEGSIEAVIRSVRESLPDADLLVVDDGSTDRTAALARAAGARVASLPFNQGVGAAHQTAYMFAVRAGYGICGQIDGDGQHPASELAKLIEEIASGRADLAVGTRFSGEGDYRGSKLRRLGQKVFGRMVSISTGQRFTDTTSGMRALDRRAMILFTRRYSPEFAEVESLQQAVRAGLTVVEVPVSMQPRQAGSSFITPLVSLFYIFKTVMVLLVNHLRPAETVPEGESK